MSGESSRSSRMAAHVRQSWPIARPARGRHPRRHAGPAAGPAVRPRRPRRHRRSRPLESKGRAYYRRKLAAGKAKAEAMSASSDASPMPSSGGYEPTPTRAPPATETRAREGTAGRLFTPARPACTRTPALRISHSRKPHPRRYAHHEDTEEDDPKTPHPGVLTLEGCRSGARAGERTGSPASVSIAPRRHKAPTPKPHDLVYRFGAGARA